MVKKPVGLLVPALVVLSCSASSAFAEGSFFLFKSKVSGRCLHVQQGESGSPRSMPATQTSGLAQRTPAGAEVTAI